MFRVSRGMNSGFGQSIPSRELLSQAMTRPAPALGRAPCTNNMVGMFSCFAVSHTDQKTSFPRASRVLLYLA